VKYNEVETECLENNSSFFKLQIQAYQKANQYLQPPNPHPKLSKVLIFITKITLVFVTAGARASYGDNENFTVTKNQSSAWRAFLLNF
jgi:hypothetical protein